MVSAVCEENIMKKVSKIFKVPKCITENKRINKKTFFGFLQNFSFPKPHEKHLKLNKLLTIQDRKLQVTNFEKKHDRNNQHNCPKVKYDTWH